MRLKINPSVMLLFALSISICSCGGGTGNSGNSVVKQFTISNPHQNAQVIGFNPPNTNYVDVKLKVAIRTLDANGNATAWGTPFVKTYTIGSTILSNFIENISVPSNQRFVVEITTEALNCSTYGAITPCNVLTGAKQFFITLRTYTNANSWNYQFYLSPDYQQCC